MMPEIVIENNKYIYNISCKLWSKKQDIIDCLKDIPDTITNILEQYKYYLEWCSSKQTITANKQYFEHVISLIEI